MPAWRCFTAGSPSRKLASAEPVATLVPVCEMAHGQAGKCECRDVYHVRRDDAVPRQASLLREIVVAGAKSGQVDRHEAVLGAEGVARGKRVAIGKNVVDADRALIDDVTFI